MTSVATEKYWSDHWKKVIFDIALPTHPIRKWIEDKIPTTTTGTCMEIGCYPGKFLAVFGERGYELNGVDSYKGVRDLYLNSFMYRNLYRVLEPKTLDNHVLSTMNLEKIVSMLKTKGFKIEYAGYIGKFYFRYVSKHTPASQLCARLLNTLSPFMSLFPESMYKRYMGVIASRN